MPPILYDKSKLSTSTTTVLLLMQLAGFSSPKQNAIGNNCFPGPPLTVAVKNRSTTSPVHGKFATNFRATNNKKSGREKNMNETKK